jgi:hypothetical protein
VAQLFGAFLVLFAGLGISAAEAGFRSPESRVRNVYAYYGDRSSDLSGGLPRDPATARRFFDPSLHCRERTGRLGHLRCREAHDSLRMFLAQYRN